MGRRDRRRLPLRARPPELTHDPDVKAAAILIWANDGIAFRRCDCVVARGVGLMGAVDFTDARRIVREYLLDRWTSRNGTLHIAERGFKDATHWRVLAGTAPASRSEDESPEAPMPPEEMAYLVDQSTGQLEIVQVTGNETRLAAMLPWGAGSTPS